MRRTGLHVFCAIAELCLVRIHVSLWRGLRQVARVRRAGAWADASQTFSVRAFKVGAP